MISNLTSAEVRKNEETEPVTRKSLVISGWTGGIPSMSIQSRRSCADYSLFRKKYSKIPPVRQEKPGEIHSYFTNASKNSVTITAAEAARETVSRLLPR